MDYFTFFDLPTTLSIDAAALKKAFLQNTKKFHPDFYTLESEEKQAEILQLSTLNNDAYRVLSDFDLRIKYVLDKYNIMGAEGTNKLPQDFLIEMMDLNEAIGDATDEESRQRILPEIEVWEQNIRAEVQPILDNWASEAADSEEMLKKVKIFYLKRKYLLRIRENLSTFAPL